MAGFAAEVSALAIRYGLNKPPTLDDHGFVSTVVFDSSKPAGTPKQRFAYLFPSRASALVSVRLKAGLSEAQRSHAIDLIREAVAMPQWRLQNGGSYLVTGEPVIVHDLTGSITHSIELLLIAVLLVMAVVLSLIFKGRPRLLPLGVAVLAAALTFGALALWGASLTMASVAVLPVLVGLSVDYAIQFQSRIHEARAAGATDTLDAVRHAAIEGAPAIATAALASARRAARVDALPGADGARLRLAPRGGRRACLPLRPHGRVGGDGACRWGGWVSPFGGDSRARANVGFLRARARVTHFRVYPHLLRRLVPAWQGAREILTDNAFTRLVSRLALDVSVRRPGRVLAIGLALAVLGWGLDTQTHVQTDIAKLAPQSLSSLHNLTRARARHRGGRRDRPDGELPRAHQARHDRMDDPV